MFILTHQPGSLYAVFRVLADYHLNITKIESRPIMGRPFEYLFYLDLEWQENAMNDLEKVLEIIKGKTEQFHCLGYYKRCLKNHGKQC